MVEGGLPAGRLSPVGHQEDGEQGTLSPPLHPDLMKNVDIVGRVSIRRVAETQMGTGV